jgi:hypothetical protein
MRGEEPLVHRHMRIFVNGSNRGRELLSAFAAAIKARARCFADNGISGVNHTTVRADWPVWPADSLEMLPCGGFIVKDWIDQIDRHFRGSNVALNVSQPSLFVKCIIADILIIRNPNASEVVFDAASQEGRFV